MLRLSSITPQLIIIEPPERLVIEVQSSGAYDVINWRRNGASYTFNDPDFPITSDRFFYFYEAYVRQPTSMDDLGLYEVNVFHAGGQNTALAPDQFFTVVRYGEFCTSVFASNMQHAPHRDVPLQVSTHFWTLALLIHQLAICLRDSTKYRNYLRLLLVNIVMVWIANAQTLCPKAVHLCLQITNTPHLHKQQLIFPATF